MCWGKRERGREREGSRGSGSIRPSFLLWFRFSSACLHTLWTESHFQTLNHSRGRQSRILMRLLRLLACYLKRLHNISPNAVLKVRQRDLLLRLLLRLLHVTLSPWESRASQPASNLRSSQIRISTGWGGEKRQMQILGNILGSSAC